MRNILSFMAIFAVLILTGAGCFDFLATSETETETEVNGEQQETMDNGEQQEDDEEEEETAEAQAESRTVVLSEQNDSGQSGTVVLEEENGQTTVTLNVTEAPEGVEQPAHIHVGTCATIGGIQFPLNSAVDGQSTTVLDMTLAEILDSSTQLSINVHQSVPEISTYVACGDLKI